MATRRVSKTRSLFVDELAIEIRLQIYEYLHFTPSDVSIPAYSPDSNTVKTIVPGHSEYYRYDTTCNKPGGQQTVETAEEEVQIQSRTPLSALLHTCAKIRREIETYFPCDNWTEANRFRIGWKRIMTIAPTNRIFTSRSVVNPECTTFHVDALYAYPNLLEYFVNTPLTNTARPGFRGETIRHLNIHFAMDSLIGEEPFSPELQDFSYDSVLRQDLQHRTASSQIFRAISASHMKGIQSIKFVIVLKTLEDPTEPKNRMEAFLELRWRLWVLWDRLWKDGPWCHPCRPCTCCADRPDVSWKIVGPKAAPKKIPKKIPRKKKNIPRKNISKTSTDVDQSVSQVEEVAAGLLPLYCNDFTTRGGTFATSTHLGLVRSGFSYYSDLFDQMRTQMDYGEFHLKGMRTDSGCPMQWFVANPVWIIALDKFGRNPRFVPGTE